MRQDLNKFVSSIQKTYGDSKIYRASEAPKVEVIPTGIASLDYKLGVGGIPRGCVVEIFGRESAGKTSLSYYLVSEVQKRGGTAGFINLEGNFDPSWANRIADVDTARLVVSPANPGMESVQLMGEYVSSNAFDIVVFDSLGAMIGDKEQDFKEKKQAGGQSALITHMAKLVMEPAAINQTTVVFLNQVRDVFSAMYPTEESPGGHAVKHSAAIRIHLKPGGAKADIVKMPIDDEKEVVVMRRITAHIKKNKIGAPNKTAAWNFWNYESPEGILGIDRTQDLIDLSMSTGIIEKSGSWYSHPVLPNGK